MKHIITRAYARQRELGWRRLASMADWVCIGFLLLMVYLLVFIGGCQNAGAY